MTKLDFSKVVSVREAVVSANIKSLQQELLDFKKAIDALEKKGIENSFKGAGLLVTEVKLKDNGISVSFTLEPLNGLYFFSSMPAQKIVDKSYAQSKKLGDALTSAIGVKVKVSAAQFELLAGEDAATKVCNAFISL